MKILFLTIIIILTPLSAHAFTDDEFCFYIMQSKEAVKTEPWTINEFISIKEIEFSCANKTVNYKEFSESPSNSQDIQLIQEKFNGMYCAAEIESLKPALDSGWLISHTLTFKDGNVQTFEVNCN